MNTPKLALSDEWKDELRRRDEEMIQVQESEPERQGAYIQNNAICTSLGSNFFEYLRNSTPLFVTYLNLILNVMELKLNCFIPLTEVTTKHVRQKTRIMKVIRVWMHQI